VRRIRCSPASRSCDCIGTSILNDTIRGASTRIPSRHTNKDGFVAWLSSNDSSETICDDLRLLGRRVVHEEADLTLPEHACQV
jgi:hypothetical protein